MRQDFECVILIGLPAAGKSTLYRDRFATTHVHISKDLWRTAAGREARQREILDKSLAGGFSAVVDNTNPTAAERAALIRIARLHGCAGYRIFLRCHDASRRCPKRVRSGQAKVPNVAIFTVARRLEVPSKTEGFDQLFRVEIADDRSLRVNAIPE